MNDGKHFDKKFNTFSTFWDNIEEANPVDNIEDEEYAREQNEEHEIHPCCPNFLSISCTFLLWPVATAVH